MITRRLCTLAHLKFEKIKSKKSDSVKALIEAIIIAGNANRLANLMGIENGVIYRWVYSKCPPGKNLMLIESGYKVAEAIKKKGLAERLCPTLKKIKKY